MPVHKGHLALIDFASSQCDELIVSMSYTDLDPIDASIRFSWLKSIYKESGSSMRIEMVKDDFDDETLVLEERTKLWAQFIQNRFPKIDVVFSSEPYGDPLSKHLGAKSVLFDLNRDQFPVSAIKIREQPMKYWDFIPTPVRPFFVKKICFYGPESTGKTEMARRMAAHYQTEFVPEVAREMITSNDFTLADIIQIGEAQTKRIKEKCKRANKLLFCDTDLITTQIYSQQYMNEVPPVLVELENQIQYDMYFLFDIDVPWVPDGLRDLGHKRSEMASIFKSELERRAIPYTLVSGTWEERFELIKKEIDQLSN
jgi:HTH-type transcriptional repressor of NAD biosynthesis genes